MCLRCRSRAARDREFWDGDYGCSSTLHPQTRLCFFSFLHLHFTLHHVDVDSPCHWNLFLLGIRYSFTHVVEHSHIRTHTYPSHPALPQWKHDASAVLSRSRHPLKSPWRCTYAIVIRASARRARLSARRQSFLDSTPQTTLT